MLRRASTTTPVSPSVLTTIPSRTAQGERSQSRGAANKGRTPSIA